MPDRVIAFAPATVGNTGPCYDILGYALNDVGDFVEVEKVDASENVLLWNTKIMGHMGGHLAGIDHINNSAWIAASQVLTDHWKPRHRDFSLRMTLHKYLPIGSGIGSSAASAVAAVKSVVDILGLRLPPEAIVEALEVAEEATAGTGYPDNVVPSYFGGLYLINENDVDDGYPGSGNTYTRIRGGDDMISVIVRPDLTLMTADGRDAVRDYIYRRYIDPRYIDPDPSQAAMNILHLARSQSAKTAELVIAFMRNDIARVGALMRDNPLLEDARSHLIPGFNCVKRAAMDGGAYGCTISGAGPAVVAITDSRGNVEHIRDVMRDAFKPLQTHWLISRVNEAGASVVDSVQSFTQRARASNNFYDSSE